MSQATDAPFAVLQGHQYMNLTTHRKNGTTIATPVWFAQEGQKLYVMTSHDAGKIKRIRNNGQIEVGPCDQRGTPLGPTVAAQARVLSEAEAKQADKALSRKYGLIKVPFDLMGKLRGGLAYVEVVALNGAPRT